MTRITVTQIKDHIWLMNDNDEATGYVVTGKEKALVIDTMNGYEDVHAVARTITNLPIQLVNTHGHPDHVYGNIYFEEAYIHPADIPLAEQYFSNPEFEEAIQKAGKKPAKWKEILPGEIIDLGDFTLEVIGIPGHTPGSIMLLDRQDRILFTGDSIIEQTWIQLPESLSAKQFVAELEKVYGSCRQAFDQILTGHARGLEDAGLCEAHLEGVREVSLGQTEQDEPYEWFGGVHKAHYYGAGVRRICYDPAKQEWQIQ